MSGKREIEADRIKPLHVKGRIVSVKGFEPTEEQMHQRVAEKIAEEFASKLFEFNKVKIWQAEDGSTHYEVTLEVIVPETPKTKE
jgi:hypothetical protein